jgi:methyl-accepting chemotaxis protein
MSDLDKHRELTHRIFIALLWLHVPLNIIACLLVDGPWLLVGSATAVAAALATATWRLSPNPLVVRATNAAALMVVISLLLAGMSGKSWQLDVHMYYFAALALVAIYCDSWAIIAAAAVVAVHHLLLNFVLPYAIYPGGGDLGRVVLHAVVLIMEAAGLIWMSEMLQRAFRNVGQSLNDAERAQAKAEAATGEVVAAQDAERKSVAERKDYQERVTAQQDAMVGALAGKLARIASGDLTARVEENFAGEFQKIKADFNAAIGNLEAAMQGVAASTTGVRSGTEEISTASNDLSRRTEQQAASLEQTAAALDEITATVKRSAEGAQHARQVVSGADEDAKKSAVVVRQAVEAMDAITKSSQEIGQIIGVIDEIAFQTNLLALNAGVEAARAGDAGRGFAVVASEVRALAQRSAQAAKEIKALISTSSAQVGTGARLVAETGEALQRIVLKVSEINTLVLDIVNGAKEQATGLGEINLVINQMDQMTQQNAAMAEEATAASVSLAKESERLSDLVGQFEVGRGDAGKTMRREPTKAAPHAYPSRRSAA